jgi:hypothetical protein
VPLETCNFPNTERWPTFIQLPGELENLLSGFTRRLGRQTGKAQRDVTGDSRVTVEGGSQKLDS